MAIRWGPSKKMTSTMKEIEGYPKLVAKSDYWEGVPAKSDIITQKKYCKILKHSSSANKRPLSAKLLGGL